MLVFIDFWKVETENNILHVFSFLHKLSFENNILHVFSFLHKLSFENSFCFLPILSYQTSFLVQKIENCFWKQKIREKNNYKHTLSPISLKNKQKMCGENPKKKEIWIRISWFFRSEPVSIFWSYIFTQNSN